FFRLPEPQANRLYLREAHVAGAKPVRQLLAQGPGELRTELSPEGPRIEVERTADDRHQLFGSWGREPERLVDELRHRVQELFDPREVVLAERQKHLHR